MASAVYNMFRGEGSRVVSPKDFLPEERPEATDEELIDAMVAVFSEVGNLKQQQPN